MKFTGKYFKKLLTSISKNAIDDDMIKRLAQHCVDYIRGNRSDCRNFSNRFETMKSGEPPKSVKGSKKISFNKMIAIEQTNSVEGVSTPSSNTAPLKFAKTTKNSDLIKDEEEDGYDSEENIEETHEKILSDRNEEQEQDNLNSNTNEDDMPEIKFDLSQLNSKQRKSNLTTEKKDPNLPLTSPKKKVGFDFQQKKLKLNINTNIENNDIKEIKEVQR